MRAADDDAAGAGGGVGNVAKPADRVDHRDARAECVEVVGMVDRLQVRGPTAEAGDKGCRVAQQLMHQDVGWAGAAQYLEQFVDLAGGEDGAQLGPLAQ